VIDLHCHVLPGIDDGPTTIEGSIALGRAAAAAGTHTIVATPHVNRRYDNDAQTIASLVAETNAAFAIEGLDVEVLPGAEISAARIADLAADELAALTLGGAGWLLIECPFRAAAGTLMVPLLYLRDRGYNIILAHPERSPAFQRDPQALRSFVSEGMLTSITAGSLAGAFGGDVRRFALRLIREELVHNVASDAHDDVQRPPTIAGELEEAGIAPLGEWLTQDVPGAILGGGEITPRPHFALGHAHRARRPWRKGS
jgi:protein-tyrosine phosphatase